MWRSWPLLPWSWPWAWCPFTIFQWKCPLLNEYGLSKMKLQACSVQTLYDIATCLKCAASSNCFKIEAGLVLIGQSIFPLVEGLYEVNLNDVSPVASVDLCKFLC